MRVLIINSDLAVNRGDRAIAEGLIALVREALPGAQITIVSQHAQRDREWYGTDVLSQNIHSLNPLDWWRLTRAAARADLVLWGGGELLKDYTNRLGVAYWALKIRCVSAVNPNVIGVFQGIGPTSAQSSRRRIARTVNRTKAFVTRDSESKDKLEAWGVPAGRVIASFDSAVYAQLAADVPRPFEQYAAIAPRAWFHYKTGGWLPHRWRGSSGLTPGAQLLEDRTVELIDHLVDTYGAAVIVPMHMEQDADLASRLRGRAKRPERVRALAADELSPAQLRGVIAGADLMVAQRLHAGIIAASVSVPTITYYYVDKGRLFADQAGTDQFARPIEKLLEADALADFAAMVPHVAGAETTEPDARIGRMRAGVREGFAAALAVAGYKDIAGFGDTAGPEQGSP